MKTKTMYALSILGLLLMTFTFLVAMVVIISAHGEGVNFNYTFAYISMLLGGVGAALVWSFVLVVSPHIDKLEDFDKAKNDYLNAEKKLDESLEQTLEYNKMLMNLIKNPKVLSSILETSPPPRGARNGA